MTNTNDTTITYTETIVTREEVEITSCACCFEFEFVMLGLSKEPCYLKVNDSEFVHYSNKHKILPFMFKDVNGETINRIDKNGMKQGRWDTIYCDKELDFFRKAKECLFNITYQDNKAKIAEIRKFYPNGKLQWKVVFHDYKVFKSEKYKKKGKL